jgi:hypothetical protein
MIRLEKAGALAEEQLLAAFDDPRCVRKRHDPNSSEQSPAERVSCLLDYIQSRRLGERLAHLVDHVDWRVSGPAIKARAALGRMEDLPFALKFLAEQDRSAQEGIELGIEQGWIEPEFKEGLLAWTSQHSQLGRSSSIAKCFSGSLAPTIIVAVGIKFAQLLLGQCYRFAGSIHRLILIAMLGTKCLIRRARLPAVDRQTSSRSIDCS